MSEKRRELVETVVPVDNKLAKAFCSERPISAADLQVCVGNDRLNLYIINNIYLVN